MPRKDIAKAKTRPSSIAGKQLQRNLLASTKTVKSLSGKLVYITLYPEKYPRVKKIATTLKDQNITFQPLIPKIRIKLGTRKIERLISAFVTYTSFLLQILLTDADIYWVATSPDIFALPLILRKEDYILDYRSPWPLQVELEFGKGRLSQIANYLTYTSLKHAKVITLTTSTLLKDVKKFGKQVYIIPNYPEKSRFKPNVSYDNFRKLHNVKKDQRIVLFIGMLSKIEGADILPSIVEGLLEKTKKIGLWIVGDGVLRSVAEELERKFPETVTFFGWRPYKEIPDFVNAADVCIVPRHETSFSDYYNEEGVHKISEYMLLEKPIVACGIAPSEEYLLVKRQDLVRGILETLEGKAPKPTPRTWGDDCSQKVLELIKFIKNARYTR
jgi:glycosyltransferase involved in cell wall biosynthesis